MSLAPGAIVADYRVDRLLARGGSASVYAAPRLAYRQPVALKVLSRGVDRDRALREVAIARTLDHPGLVRLLDHGATVDESIFLVMELSVGETLAAHEARSPWSSPPPRCAR